MTNKATSAADIADGLILLGEHAPPRGLHEAIVKALESYAEAKVKEAYEQAALVCETQGLNMEPELMREEFAKAIRQLKEGVGK